MITILKQNLFDVPKESIIVHACNSKGIWGSGIAKEFKERYPYSYLEYRFFCKNSQNNGISNGDLSSFHIDEPHHVGWIVTSKDYGINKDDVETIKIQTTLALNKFCKKVYSMHEKDEIITVCSNKFNSGLFAVPWKDSERILNVVLKQFKRINWIVCDPNLEVENE